MSNLFKFLLIINFVFLKNHVKSIQSTIIDPNGYIAYCPCMGRFGNQADHFLGSLRFAHELNRTLILPPWVEYRKRELRSRQIPFDKYFKVEALKEYHRVITMHEFMEKIAPEIWPPEKRTAFCYMERRTLNSNSTDKSCNSKEGNPFGPFWDEFTIDFNDSEFYGPLTYDVVHTKGMIDKWNEKYPNTLWPVLAFTGAPASFPIQIENLNLQKYLIWSTEIMNKTFDFLNYELPKGAYIGIHLRNGMDWIRACDHIKTSPNLFAAPQCLGYRNERGNATMDMCLPSRDIIVRQIKRVIKRVASTSPNDPIRSVFVASDNNHLIQFLNDALFRMKVRAYSLNEPNPHLELSILGRSNHFIGNCISSFSAFVKRQRDSNGFPSSFWGYPTEKYSSNGSSSIRKKNTNSKHEEL